MVDLQPLRISVRPITEVIVSLGGGMHSTWNLLVFQNVAEVYQPRFKRV